MVSIKPNVYIYRSGSAQYHLIEYYLFFRRQDTSADENCDVWRNENNGVFGQHRKLNLKYPIGLKAAIFLFLCGRYFMELRMIFL